jgi:REP element-mobilizing transposase RayT
MAQHAFSKCLLHMIWGTKNRKAILEKPVRKKLSNYFYSYAEKKGIFMQINYVNADHVHIFIDLPTNYSIQQVAKLFKGSSSHWINKHRLTNLKFSWGRGYGAFSVSASAIEKVKSYIRNQPEHHRKKTFQEELDDFLSVYELEVQNR